MAYLIVLLVGVVIGFGVGRIKNRANFEARVAADVVAVKAKL